MIGFITVVLIAIAGLANGIGDRIKFHDPWPDSNFWSEASWRNVYLNGNVGMGAKFFGSTSFLAFLCDGWHLMKFIQIESIFIAIAINATSHGILTYLVLRAAYFIGFSITYK